MSITISDEGVKKRVEIFLKGKNINKYISTAEYNSLRNFINRNTNIEADIDGISNVQLMRVLSSLDITLGR